MPKETVYKPSEKLKKIYSGGTLTPPLFMHTFFEWLSQKAEKIMKNGSLPTGSSPVYTVPVDHVFFLTGVVIAVDHDHASAGYYSAYIDKTSSIIAYLRLKGLLKHSNQVREFVIPIRLEQGQKVGLNNATGRGIMTLIVNGFLIQKDLLPEN